MSRRRLTGDDVEVLAALLFVIYLFVSCCASDISSAYAKMKNQPNTVIINN